MRVKYGVIAVGVVGGYFHKSEWRAVGPEPHRLLVHNALSECAVQGDHDSWTRPFAFKLHRGG